MRGIIKDDTIPYAIPDLRLLKYLDLALDKLSEIKPISVQEDLVIDSTNISNGYVDVSREIQSVRCIPIGVEGINWEVDSGKRIRFIDTSTIVADTYEDITYDARYKKFDGQIRENSYFDYPRSLDLAVVFYALALYQEENGIIDATGEMSFKKSKSEEGMSVSYGSLGGVEEVLGAPSTLKARAIDMMRNQAGSVPIFLSV